MLKKETDRAEKRATKISAMTYAIPRRNRFFTDLYFVFMIYPQSQYLY
jgi:hypothetical protein